MLGEQNSHRASLLAIVQTVNFDDLNCRPSDTPMWSSDCPIRRFGVQIVLIDYWECRPSNCTAVAAAVAAADSDL